MSDQEAKSARMPDPGTPFPLVPTEGAIKLERSGSDLKISAASLERLKQALPDCMIDH